MSTPALLAVWDFRLGFCTALWDISWCTKGYINLCNLIWFDWEHLDWLHHHLVWQLLGIRPQSTTKCGAYGPVHHWGWAPCHPGPLYQAVSEEGSKMIKDFSHPSHILFSLLPHDKQYRCTKSGTNRTPNSFYPQAIRLLNSLLNS
jgi:hypothetical protein